MRARLAESMRKKHKTIELIAATQTKPIQSVFGKNITYKIVAIANAKEKIANFRMDSPPIQVCICQKAGFARLLQKT